jgi:hypothetical protein
MEGIILSIDSALALAKRLKRDREADDQPIVVLIQNDPEVHQRLGRSLSGREAMIGSELFSAGPNESVKQFHRRLVQVARERIVELERGIRTVSIGDDEPVKECLFNSDGSRITIN